DFFSSFDFSFSLLAMFTISAMPPPNSSCISTTRCFKIASGSIVAMGELNPSISSILFFLQFLHKILIEEKYQLRVFLE
ncbi:hypothetical protein ALC57_03127, partial [Trachymyrmex cornetzi]